MYRLLGLMFWLLALSAPARAEQSPLRHIPPLVTPSAPMPLVISAVGVRRARALVVSREGYHVLPLERVGEQFKAFVSFDSLSSIRYQFQVESESGRFFESEFFDLRQPADAHIEEQIAKLEKRVNDLSAQEQQVQNAIHSLENADPESLVKRKNKEYARAMVLLSQRERELAELKRGKGGE